MGRAWLARATVCTVLLGTNAYAQDDAATIATRRTLLDDAAHARERGDHAHALESALAAARISITPSVALFIAEEEQTLGQATRAFESARRCANMTEEETTVQNRELILARCRELTDQLRPRVGLLTLAFSQPLPSDAAVTVDANRVDLATSPIAVDPGDVAIEVTASGMQTYTHHETVTAGGTLSVTIDTSQFVRASSSSSSPAAAIPAASTSRSGVRTYGPYVIAGAGALFLAAAIPFYLSRNDAISQCVATETNVLCTQSQYNTANTYNTLTNVAWITGTVLAAGGVAWWIIERVTRQSTASEHARRRAVPYVQWFPGGAGVGIGGEL